MRHFFLIMSAAISLVAGEALQDRYVGEIRNGYFRDKNPLSEAWQISSFQPNRVSLNHSARGGRELTLECNSGGMQLAQTIHFDPGKKYCLSFCYRMSDITPYSNLRLDFPGNPPFISRLDPPNTGWNGFSMVFRAPATEAKFYLSFAKPGQTLTVSEFRLTAAPPKIINGGFECFDSDIPAGWQSSDPGIFARSSDAGKGEFALMMTEGTGFMNTTVTEIAPGRDFALTALVKGGAGSMPTIKIHMLDIDGKKLERPGIIFTFQVNNDWQPIERLFFLPQETAILHLAVGGDAEKGSIWFDNLELEEK